jgi:uncharacterized DUF497 family protein
MIFTEARDAIVQISVAPDGELTFEALRAKEDTSMSVSERLGISDHEFRVVFGRTKIDFDPHKEKENIKRHRYSLESAVYLLERILMPWGSKVPRMISDAFEEKGEVRHTHMCVDDHGDVVFMVTTMRPDETVRVISFRRASEEEREHFRQNTGYAKPTNGACSL